MGVFVAIGSGVSVGLGVGVSGGMGVLLQAARNRVMQNSRTVNGFLFIGPCSFDGFLFHFA